MSWYHGLSSHPRCPACVDIPYLAPWAGCDHIPRFSGDDGSTHVPRDVYKEMQDQAAEHRDEQRRKEVRNVCAQLQEALKLRERYLRLELERAAVDESLPPDDPWSPPPWGGRPHGHEMRDGVVHVWDPEDSEQTPVYRMPPSLEQYSRDQTRLAQICSDAAVNAFCHQRLQKLEARFELHLIENQHHEVAEQRAVPHRDFYNLRKVDTHVRLAAAMNQKHLLRFIKKKARVSPHDVVATGTDGKARTLAQVFDELGISPQNLSLDALGMHADGGSRFDRESSGHDELGKSRLREIFLCSDNLLRGRYLAELTRELFDDLEESKYQNSEYRLSIDGRSRDEWDALAAWVVDHRLHSPNNRWLVQIPRLRAPRQVTGTLQMQSFEEMLRNIFLPLFEVSIDPASHPKLHLMLQQRVGLDCVGDDECYYLYANLYVLNQLRAAQGLSQLCFRPHAGEAGELGPLHAAFLTARGISHGVSLRRAPSLQYLYYLAQVGLSISPISSNASSLLLRKNPFYEFFSVGLNVSLATDGPLMSHHTKEPLMEEYCVAKQVWRLSSVDLAEIARNSVLQSSFEGGVKAAWLGTGFRRAGVAGNDVSRTNLPNLRAEYRQLLLSEELDVVSGAVADDESIMGMFQPEPEGQQQLQVALPSPSPPLPALLPPGEVAMTAQDLARAHQPSKERGRGQGPTPTQSDRDEDQLAAESLVCQPCDEDDGEASAQLPAAVSTSAWEATDGEFSEVEARVMLAVEGLQSAQRRVLAARREVERPGHEQWSAATRVASVAITLVVGLLVGMARRGQK